MKKFIFSFLLLSSAGIISAQNDIIIDNGQATFDGPWETSKGSKDRYGDDYKSSFCVVGPATATATFRPKIAVSGKYNVEVIYPRGDNRTTNAPWLISFDGGTLSTNISQRVSDTKWVRLASGILFAAGEDGFVRLSNNSGGDKETSAGKAVVIADAVRFVLVGKSGPAPQASPGPAPAWRFAAQISVKGSGDVLKAPDQPGYAGGESVEFTAQPEKGNVFVGWSGDAVGMDNPLKVKVNSNVILTAEFLPEALGVILESSEAKLDGRWAPNTQKWVGQRSESYLFAISSTDADNVATYTPNLPKAGKYDVYIYYLQGENRAVKTSWEIVSKTGATTVQVDQRANGREWFQIAAGREFEAGKKGYVRVTGKAEPIPSVVVADSVAFVYVGP
ncbi:MAG: hypothetical protein JWM68_2749 [Verrucomicrobiales bacterium]|nr:hypothetical protein [Verrucomicrobiales bacterium]